MIPKVGHYIRWWVNGDLPGIKKSYAGTVVKLCPGWMAYYLVACNDGQLRRFFVSSVGRDGEKYKPEYIDFTEKIGVDNAKAMQQKKV